MLEGIVLSKLVFMRPCLTGMLEKIQAHTRHGSSMHGMATGMAGYTSHCALRRTLGTLYSVLLVNSEVEIYGLTEALLLLCRP